MSKIQLKESDIRNIVRGILNEEMNELHPLTRINYANKRSEQYYDELDNCPDTEDVTFDIPENCKLVDTLMSQGYYEDTDEAINCIRGAFENIYYDMKNGVGEYRAFDNAMQELYLDMDYMMDVAKLYYNSLREPEVPGYNGRSEDDIWLDLDKTNKIRNKAKNDLINASNLDRTYQVAKDHRAGNTRYEGGKWYDGAGKEIPESTQRRNKSPKLESKIVGNKVHINESDIRKYIRECIKETINEECGMGGATSCAGMFTGTGVDDGQYTVPFGGVQRRKKDKAFDRTPGNIAMNNGFKKNKQKNK